MRHSTWQLCASGKQLNIQDKDEESKGFTHSSSCDVYVYYSTPQKPQT